MLWPILDMIGDILAGVPAYHGLVRERRVRRGQRRQQVSTYDPYRALQSIDQNIVPIAIGMTIALSLTFVYFYEAIRLGFRHRAFSPPLAATLWFLPHDLSFVLRYDQWFNVYDHWWVKIWWCGLVATVGIELLLLWQTIRWGHDEIMPQASQKTFACGIAAAAVGAGVIWWLVKASVDDELFLTSFLMTIVWPMPFTTAQILRRRSRKGISVLQETVLAPMFLGLWGALCLIDPFFRSPVFIALAVVAVCWALFNVWLVRRAPDYRPA